MPQLDIPQKWNSTEEHLLKRWGEQAASLRLLHDKAHRLHRKRNFYIVIPVIVITTITGTANFSQGTITELYPESEHYMPLGIGFLNLVAGIITTIGQYIRTAELMESHRASSISYGKLSRSIRTELALPPLERTSSGIEFIRQCRDHMDTLLEQSPDIQLKVLKEFQDNRRYANIYKPENMDIDPFQIYVKNVRPNGPCHKPMRKFRSFSPVSYTHLTLPTICSV